MSLKLKSIFLLISILFLHPFFLNAQSTNTKFKIGFESGRINSEGLGAGLFFRPSLKISGQKKFTNSSLRIKTNGSSEILDLDNRINGIHIFGHIEYNLSFGREKILVSGAAKNQIHFIESNTKQTINEFQARFQFAHTFSRTYSVQFKEWFIKRELRSQVKTTLSKNAHEAEIIIRSKGASEFKMGLIFEHRDFNYPNFGKKQQQRYGPTIGYNYKKKFILSSSYQYGLFKEDELTDHQLNILAGKYISKKLSLFLFVYYIWRIDETNLNTSEPNSLENYNNISIKLGYDLKKKSYLYLKLLFEEQEIFQVNSKVSTIQAMIGLQQTL